jgi:hypothetical protein
MICLAECGYQYVMHDSCQSDLIVVADKLEPLAESERLDAFGQRYYVDQDYNEPVNKNGYYYSHCHLLDQWYQRRLGASRRELRELVASTAHWCINFMDAKNFDPLHAAHLGNVGYKATCLKEDLTFLEEQVAHYRNEWKKATLGTRFHVLPEEITV